MEDIIFHRRNGNIIITNQPYISRDFLSAPANGSISNPLADSGMTMLGIFQLELCFSVALEDREICKRYLAIGCPPPPFPDLAIVMEWCYRRAIDEAGPENASAIR